MDSVLCFANTYLPDSDLSGGSTIQPSNNMGQKALSDKLFKITGSSNCSKVTTTIE